MIELTEAQLLVVREIIAWYLDPKAPQEYYLAGFAGVGKSTLVDFVIKELEAHHKLKRVRTAAYTGKAASVLRKKGVKEAQTIHSLIYTAEEDDEGHISFVLSEDSPAADAQLICLDECSMVADEMATDLRSFGKKILIIGDPGQLPPVKGAGAFTNRNPDAFLHEIHRQHAESPILELATMARKGEPLPIGYSKGNVRVLKLDKDSQNFVYDIDAQPICGLNRVRWVYTQRIRKRMGIDSPIPEVGERIMCCKNNRKHGFFNGNIGELKSFDLKRAEGFDIERYQFDVKFDDFKDPMKELIVDPFLFNQHFTNGATQKAEWVQGRKRYDEFDWGYVLTAHKAQGSSWKNVTVVNDSGSFRDDRHKWLYTALTRAEEGLTVLMR